MRNCLPMRPLNRERVFVTSNVDHRIVHSVSHVLSLLLKGQWAIVILYQAYLIFLSLPSSFQKYCVLRRFFPYPVLFSIEISKTFNKVKLEWHTSRA